MLFSALAHRWRNPSAHAVLLRRCAGSTPAAPAAAAPAASPARHQRGWYAAALAAGDLTDARTPVRGCAILKPRGYALWEHIRADLDARIRGLGAQNVSFPLLVPASLLQREQTHVAGFAAECAVVTHHRLAAVAAGAGAPPAPDPAAALPEPYVVRPTSEALVWDAFSRWVQSHRDLPLRVNQWANVVRWELRTRPFLRTSEFQWQEGHTAHASAGEAAAQARAALAMYSDHLRHFLAVPAIAGEKSASERFAGAAATLTCEAVLPNGWALQAATAHDLGQGFARAFGVTFDAAEGPPRRHAHGTSWGASTRLIGGAILQHGDDVGLCFPPRLAPTNVVVVALAGGEGGAAAAFAALQGSGSGAAAGAAGPGAPVPLRPALDQDTAAPPGRRYFEWERRGVPLRVECGRREAQAGEVSLKDRLGFLAGAGSGGGGGGGGGGSAGAALAALHRVGKGGRVSVPLAALPAYVALALAALQEEMLRRATVARDACIVRGGSYADLAAAAAEAARAAKEAGGEGEEGEAGEEGGARGGGEGCVKAFLLPWADDAAAEARVKADTRYTLRCFPHEAQGEAEGQQCSFSGKRATHMALFARAY